MVIFHSYVSLLEGIYGNLHICGLQLNWDLY